jgi:hypothetical protein
MATIALLVGGAILNATAFVGGSYLAKTLSSDGNSVNAERVRHDRALEKYQNDMGEWNKKRTEYKDWLEKQYENKKIAEGNMMDTDYGLKLYAKAHPESEFSNKEPPQFKDYYKPNTNQKNYEMAYVGGGVLGLAYIASKF